MNSKCLYRVFRWDVKNVIIKFISSQFVSSGAKLFRGFIREMTTVSRTSWGLEYSIHQCPGRFRRELKVIFPVVDPANVRMIPTCQKAEHDLTDWGETVETEKERLLERFVSWAASLCKTLHRKGYWADYIDPCSGLPMIDKKCKQPYGEVEGFSVVLGYEVANAGCCKILVHPNWGTYVYPATVFTTAPQELVSEIIKDIDLQNDMS